MYGNNVIASEGEEWKQTKKIVAPAFSEVTLYHSPLNQVKLTFCRNSYKRNNRLVWDASVRVIDGLHHEVWNNKDTISTNNFADTTLQVWFCSSKYLLVSNSNSHHEDCSVCSCHGR